DGQWGVWSEWTECSVTCGNGTQNRTRNCDSQQPQNNGEDCVGESSQTQTCNTNGCPVDGGWAAWPDWSACTVTCGGGTQLRMRFCTNPAPQNDGQSCYGNRFKLQNCSTQTCPVVPYGQSCSLSGDECAGDDTECESGTCKCVSGFYWNRNACVPKVGLGYSCLSDVACNATNADCIGGICTCNSQYYEDNVTASNEGKCKIKVELGSTGCSTYVEDSCKSPNAQCQSDGVCTCNTGFYDSNSGVTGGTCTKKVELGSRGCSTSVSDSCKSPNAHCQSSGYCTCNSGYYDSYGGAGGGTCTIQVDLEGTGCLQSVIDSCKDGNAECLINGGSCTCRTGYYDDNGPAFGGTCRK
ncbi:coadhesin-like, partial [Mercenaria mercenaria]|uniref:coadhesin-like n=1 Tax=Mercenaria mercenaria TaxID=6596 RepID=UPI00234ED8D8